MVARITRRMARLAAVYHGLPGAEPPAERKPRAKQGSPERDFARQLFRWLDVVLPLGAFAAAMPVEEQGRGRTEEERMRYGQARKASGIRTGWPDVAVVLDRGRVVWLELKAGRNGTTDAQDGLHARMRTLGHAVHVVRSIEEARIVLRGEGVSLREAAAA